MKTLQNLSLWLFWPALGLIVWGELTPHPPAFGGLLAWDKAQHFAAYFGLASMAGMIAGMGRRLFWTLLGLVVLGGALEILQGYTGRDPDIFDFLANSVGVCCGALASLALLFADRLLVAAKAAD